MSCLAFSREPDVYPLQQDGPGWQPESDWVKAGRPRSGAVKMASCHHLSEPVSATWAESTPFQCKRPSDPRWCPLCPSWGQGSPPATLRESTPGSQCWQEKETSQRTNGRETKSEILKQPCGRSTGRQTGEGVFGAWQMQGLIAGASLRPDPGTSSGDAGGNDGAGLGHPLLVLPGPPGFPELRAGFSWAAVGLTRPPWAPRTRQPGKWDTSGWPSTTCQHTWCGTRGCRAGLGAAGAPQSR